MPQYRGHRAWRSIVLACAILACAVTVAAAAPATIGTPEQIEKKKSERAAALEELEQMKARLDSEVADYISLGRRLEKTRADIAETTKRVEELDASLIDTRKHLTQRSVQMYRTPEVNLLGLLLTSESVQDFITRSHYLVMLGQNDAELLADVRLNRSEALYLEQTLVDRESRLAQMQTEADLQRSKIESDLAMQQQQARDIGADLRKLLQPRPVAMTGSAPNGSIDYDTLIAEANYRNADSMTAADIQAWLNGQPGTLKSYVTADHNGQVKSAAVMIAEACKAWGISPKVMLVTLQKEQSLIGDASPQQKQYDWAMGCGATDSGRISKYFGFGNQIWFGAKSLRSNADRYKPGVQLTIDGMLVRPSNPATYGLYKYTPHLHGNESFWLIHWRYFGDPLAG